VYFKESSFPDDALALATKHFDIRPLAYQYLNFAKKHHNDYVKAKTFVLQKKYIYIISSLFCLNWLKQQQKIGFPPMSIFKLLDEIKIEESIKIIIHELLIKKKSGGIGFDTRIKEIDDWIDSQLNEFETFCAANKSESTDTTLMDYNAFFKHTVLTYAK